MTEFRPNPEQWMADSQLRPSMPSPVSADVALPELLFAARLFNIRHHKSANREPAAHHKPYQSAQCCT